MEITLTKKDKVNASVTVSLKEADYAEKVAKKIKDYSRTAQVKGFRPGKVPSSMIHKMYGKGILVDEINALGVDSMLKYLKAEKIDILGEPLPSLEMAKKIDFDTQKDFEMIYDLGILPEFSIDLSNEKDFTGYTITVDDKAVKETVANMQKQMGAYEETEVIVADDLITGTITEKSTGRTFEGYLPLNRVDAAEVSKFIGVKKGEVATFDLRKALADNAAIAYTFGIKKEEAELLQGEFELLATRISHMTGAVLNEEFFNKAVRGKNITTLEDFEKEIRETIATNYNREAKSLLQVQVYRRLLDKVEIEFPTEFLKRWLIAINGDKLSTEQLEKEYPDFEKGLKWDLIKSKIANDNQIKVDNEEVEVKAAEMIKQSYGFGGDESEETAKMMGAFVKNYLTMEEGKNYKNMWNELHTEKVLDALVSKVTFKDKKLSIDEFKEEVKTYNL